jgi:hypothetical protein
VKAMLRVPLFARILMLVAIASGVALASALPAGADVQLESPSVAGVQVESPAIISARGAAVTVPVLVACTPGAFFVDLNVQVVQRVGSNIASGFGSGSVTCTGTIQTVFITVTAQDRAFKTGVAFATANLFVCDFRDCRTATDAREIRIVR